jgi:hypothetical protein
MWLSAEGAMELEEDKYRQIIKALKGCMGALCGEDI